MSKMDQQDVLKAIFNVKKYAKNLKKNASTMQEIEFEGGDFLEITSSPSLVAHNKQFFNEQFTEPALHQGTSFRQSVQNKKVKTGKEYSMTQLPKKKFTKKDEGFTKIKGIKKESSEDSRDYLFKSMKSEAIRNEFSYFPEKQEKRYTKQEKQKKLELWQSIVEKQSPKKKETSEVRPEIVKQLLEEIEDLNQQLNSYKKAMLIIKKQYLSLQQKLSQKINLDHFIDILKEQIEELQNDNGTLKEIIEKQNTKIQNFDQSIARITDQMRKKYEEDVKNITQINSMNEILCSLTKMQYLPTQSQEKRKDRLQENEEINFENMELSSYCKNEDELKKKWKVNEKLSA